MIQAEHLVGTRRRFASSGPLHEIVHAGVALPDCDRMMRVRVVESGEEVGYKLADILAIAFDLLVAFVKA